ncbi:MULTISPECIES: M15 family metallopeptidase [unclassified Dysgonomonas]|uniref:M15 family metallopeptidase n=1 Tax=unclassified Dysgonomonas TaxID=2630389 RepID=UPI002473EABE|nr:MULTISPECIES: M15 family metallopeptidase [unclassified Dysgonomonas]MDH6388649.1 D-alanyl-D-alanine dipeptidase [Dysgonomonas sp. PH5-37]
MRYFFPYIVFLFVLSVACQPKEQAKQDIIIAEEQSKPSVIAAVVPPVSALEQNLIDAGMVCVDDMDSTIRIELKYGTTDNFTGTVLYDSLRRAYLHPLAARKLLEAQRLLKEKHPELSLLVYDAARPVSVQKKMYEKVQNTKFRKYVANPNRTGLHNYGMAVDLTICDKQGTPLDMGTLFDYFGRAAGISEEDALIGANILNKSQVDGRRILRNIMQKAGFFTIRGEWWHFNAISLSEAKSGFSVLK